MKLGSVVNVATFHLGLKFRGKSWIVFVFRVHSSGLVGIGWR